MATFSHEDYKRQQQIKQRVQDILLSPLPEMAPRYARELSNLLPSEALVEMPMLARSWGNRLLAQAMEAIGIHGRGDGRLRPHPLLPFECPSPETGKSEAGIGWIQAVVRAPQGCAGCTQILKGLEPELAQLTHAALQHQLRTGIVEILRSYSNLSPTKLKQDLGDIRYLGSLGANLSSPKTSHAVSRAAAYYCTTITPARLGKNDIYPSMLSVLKLLKQLGARPDDLAASIHAAAIRGDYKRYTKKSELPPMSLAMSAGGFPLGEAPGMHSYDSPLATMIQYGLVRGVQQMLALGANLHWQSPHDGRTLPMMASGGKKSTMDAMEAIPVGSFSDIIDFRNHEGETALHLAVRTMSAGLVRRCFEEGADPSITNNKNKTAFELLGGGRGKKAQENFDTIVAVFADYGVDLQGGANNRFPLHAAARALSLKQVRALIEGGVDIFALDRQGRSAVDMAIDQQPSLQSASSIRKNGQQQFAVLQAIIEAGHDVNHPLRQGKTMLQLAMENRRWLLARLLMKAGADPTLTDDAGRLPFHQLSDPSDRDYAVSAVVRGQEHDLVGALRDMAAKGVDLNQKTVDGQDAFQLLRKNAVVWQAIEATRLEQQLEGSTAAIEPAPAARRGGLRL